MSRRQPAFTPAVKERIQKLHHEHNVQIVNLAKRFGCRVNLISAIVNVQREKPSNQDNKMTEGS